MSHFSSGYGVPPQVSRRDSQEQIQMITQRMKQVSMQSQQPMYQNDAYCGSRLQCDHVPLPYAPSSGSDRATYFQGYYSPSATPHGSSYSNVVSRGKDGTVGKMKE